MKTIRIVPLALLGAFLATGATLAQGADPVKAAIEARQKHMDLNAFNLMVLGGMAQEKIPYDAAVASAAAGNLAALAGMDQSRYWIEGSVGIDGTKALPAVLENYADFQAKEMALKAAADAMAGAAGNGLDALKGAMGGLGGACGSCHENFRAK